MHRQGALPALVLIAALLAGCTAAEREPLPPPPAAVPVETQTPEPERIDVSALRVEPSFKVTAAKSIRLFTGPGTFYLLIRDLPAGTPLEYLGNRESWLQVRTPDGERGWVAFADTNLTDGRGQAVTYRVQSGRWELKADSGTAVELRRLGTGVMRLTVTGLEGTPRVIPAGEGVLAIVAGVPGEVRTAADIGDGGIRRIALSPGGLLLDLEGRPHHLPVELAEGKAVLEFRPALLGLEPLPADGGWRLTYQGDLRPVLRPQTGELLLDLPGAVRPAEQGALPAGVAMAKVGPEPGPTVQAGSATALPPARMPAGGLRLTLPVPKSPFALYRTGPWELELRRVKPGLAGKTVVLDPGHGGEETGAVGSGGLVEKNVNLAVAMLLRPMLEQAGAKVIMTRTDDRRVLNETEAAKATSASERTQMDLAIRSAMANAAGADLYLSIHANGGPAGDGGTEVYWAVNNLNASLSLKLAGLAQEELVDALGLYDRGVKQRPFNVIRMSDAPAILVELGFMTNPREEQLLGSAGGQRRAAEALFRTLQRYFDSF